MKVVAISDIHISGKKDPLYGSLLSLIRSELKPGDIFVLAGDIFDFLVGNQPRLNDEYSEFFSLLREKGSSGVTIHYIEGNHDFHLDTLLKDLPGLQLSKDEVVVNTPKHRLYVAHGDLVDEEDRGYLALRKFFRSPFIRFAAFALPGRAVDWIGTRSSRVSQGMNPRTPEQAGAKRFERTRKIFRSFAEEKFKQGYDAIVLGHCHDADQSAFVDGNRSGMYMNVGFPRVHRSYLCFTDEAGLVRKALP